VEHVFRRIKSASDGVPLAVRRLCQVVDCVDHEDVAAVAEHVVVVHLVTHVELRHLVLLRHDPDPVGSLQVLE
jgi:hypothetical protein